MAMIRAAIAAARHLDRLQDFCLRPDSSVVTTWPLRKLSEGKPSKRSASADLSAAEGRSTVIVGASRRAKMTRSRPF